MFVCMCVWWWSFSRKLCLTWYLFNTAYIYYMFGNHKIIIAFSWSSIILFYKFPQETMTVVELSNFKVSVFFFLPSLEVCSDPLTNQKKYGKQALTIYHTEGWVYCYQYLGFKHTRRMWQCNYPNKKDYIVG